MNKDLIFIFEFISGGGLNKVNIPTSLFCEGFGMLRSIIMDFKAIDCEIHTMLDSRVFFLSEFLLADNIKKVNSFDNYITIFKNCVNKCKYTFVIAPETSKILYNLTKIVKKHDRIILSTNLRGINYGTSKISTYKIFKKKKILTPKTYIIPLKNNKLDLNFILHKFRELKCPIVIKPDDGVGAESIHYFENEPQILEFLMNYNVKTEKRRKFLLQEFIEGKDLSISLIGTPQLNTNPIILSVNSQYIDIKSLKSEYIGGYTPIENYNDVIEKLMVITRKLNNLNIEGYFGIDFIENKNSFNFIEINPRLTTSYIGLRNILNFNCAELIFNSNNNNINNFEIDFPYHSYFIRIDFYFNKNDNMKESHTDLTHTLIKLIPEFVTPPFSLKEQNQFSCFIATKTKDLYASKIRLKEIIEIIEKLDFTVITPIKTELS